MTIEALLQKLPSSVSEVLSADEKQALAKATTLDVYIQALISLRDTAAEQLPEEVKMAMLTDDFTSIDVSQDTESQRVMQRLRVTMTESSLDEIDEPIDTPGMEDKELGS